VRTEEVTLLSTTPIGLPGSVKKSLTALITPSTLMIVVGFLAIVLSPVTGISVTVLVASLLFFSGLMHFIYAWQTPGAIVWETLLGIAYKLMGGYVLFHRVLGLAELTPVLTMFLFAQSVLDFIVGVQLRPRRGSGWLFVDGVITLILAAMMWRTWPVSTGRGFGILVGLSMLSSGICRLKFSLGTRNLVSPEPPEG
jgi:uncharacterized membrane protein HdeD (DUF308 family)